MGLIGKFFKYLRTEGFRYTAYMTSVKIMSIFQSRGWDRSKNLPVDLSDAPDDVITFAVSIHGGMGDCIVSANYLQKLLERYGTEKIRLYIISHNNHGSVKSVFEGNPLVYSVNKSNDEFNIMYNFDMAMNLSRYPELVHIDRAKVMSVCPSFMEYVLLCNRFRTEYGPYLEHLPYLDGNSAQLTVMKGQKRISQPDIYGLLGMGEEYDFEIRIPDEETVLEKFGLSGKPYIALHRGCDNVQNDKSVKMWPLENYDSLVDLIRARFPDAVLVQFGSPLDKKIDKDLDINLVGCTSMDEMKVIVKRCAILIDNEGGTVHLRHALHGGRSIVLFGSTSPEFYGYSENINIRSECCPITCEWAINQWQDGCLKGKDPAPCMAGITPEHVLEALETIMEGDCHE